MTCEECYHRPICKRCPANADICAYAIATSDVEEVRRGKWEKRYAARNVYSYEVVLVGYECSVCHEPHEVETLYCPHCGVKMDI